jgi:MFS family permease
MPPPVAPRSSWALSARLRARRTARNALGIPRATRYSLGWDLLAGAFSGAYMGMAFPFFTKIARGELHAPEAAIALMSAAPFIGNLLSPVWARQMEGRAKMPFVIWSWLTARFLLFLMPLLAGGPWGFVALVGGLQFVGTISSPAYTSLMRDIYPDRARGRLMGYVRVGAQSMMFLATFSAGRLLDHGVSYKVLFPVAGLLGYAAAYAFSRVRPLASAAPPAQEKPTTRQFVAQTVSILRENEPFRWFAFSVFTYGFGNLMLQPLYALYQVDVLHISGTQIANLVNFASLWSILGSFFWGRFMDRYGPPRTVLLCIICITLVPLVYLSTRHWYGLLFASVLTGIGFAGVELSYMGSILTYAEPHRTAQYQSLNSLLLGVRGVIAPLVGMPLMKALGYQKVFTIAFFIMVAGCVMQYLATQTARQNRA